MGIRQKRIRITSYFGLGRIVFLFIGMLLRSWEAIFGPCGPIFLRVAKLVLTRPAAAAAAAVQQLRLADNFVFLRVVVICM